MKPTTTSPHWPWCRAGKLTFQLLRMVLSPPSTAVASWVALTAYLPSSRTMTLERKLPVPPLPLPTASLWLTRSLPSRKKLTSTRWPGTKGLIVPKTGTLP